MQKNHAKVIKGLSIASLVVSAVFLVCWLLGAVLMGALGSYAGTELLDYYSEYGSHGHGDGYYSSDLYDDYYDAQVASAMLGMSSGVFVAAALLCAVGLVASIIVLRNWDKPQNYGKVFGWSIAGAIMGFMGSGMILTALFIIMAVFANTDKKLYEAGQYYGMPGYGVPPMQYGAPGAPQQPYAPQPQQQPYASQPQVAVTPQAQAQAQAQSQVVTVPPAATVNVPYASDGSAPQGVQQASAEQALSQASAESVLAHPVEGASDAAVEAATDTRGAGADGEPVALAESSDADVVPLAEETTVSTDDAGNIVVEDAVIAVDLGSLDDGDDAGDGAKDK